MTEEELKQQISLTEEQVNSLVKTLAERIEALIQVRLDLFERQLKSTNSKIDTVQQTVDTYGNQVTEDRRDIGEIKIKSSTTEMRTKDIQDSLSTLPREVVEGVKNDMNKSEDRLADKIEEKVPNAVTEAVMGTIEPRKGRFIHIIKPRSWWDKFKSALWRK